MVKEQKTSGYALASFIMGLVGIIIGWIPLLGQIYSIAGIVLGAVGLNAIIKNDNISGKGFAITGIILNLLWIILFTLLIGIGILGGITQTAISSNNPVVIDSSVDTITNNNNDEVLDKVSQREEPSTEVKTPTKVKKASLEIDRVQIQVANLYPTRITIENTGDVTIYPKFDLYVYDSRDNEVCAGSPMFGIGSISAGNQKTEEIEIMGCMFTEDGAYTLKIDLLDSDFNKLDSATKDFNVNYWGAFS